MSGAQLRWQPFAGEGLAWSEVEGARFTCSGVPCMPGDAVVVLGAFDGVHLGHRELVAAACDEAARRAVPCVAVTFDPDPAELLVQLGLRDPQPRLLSSDDRAAALLSLGLDAVASLSFDEHMASTAPEEFVRSLLVGLVRPVSVHVGSNFRFGRGGAGDVACLADLGKSLGFAVRPHELVRRDGIAVSATHVRELLSQGSLASANALLGRCHYVRGMVEHGRGEGTSFGFPTANVRCDELACMPAQGVYACYVACGDRAWPAAANVGASPTFGGRGGAFLEANLLGFSGDLYDRKVSVSFVRWLRGSRKFDSLADLEQTVLANIAWVGEHLGAQELEVTP